jgi:DDE family transposase
MESTPARAALSVDPASVAAAFAQVPEPRRAASVIYPLPAILAMAVAAILANHRSVLAIAEWGMRQEEAMLAALGFSDGRTPCQSTLQRLFRQLDSDAVATILRTCFAASAAPAATDPPRQGVAIDGKAQRGRLRFAEVGGPFVHALSAFCHDRGIVRAHAPIDVGPDKAEAELTVAPALLARIDWRGRVLTGDALFCQTALCAQVVAAGGDDLLLVKENQGTLSNDLALLFDPPATAPAALLTDRRLARTVECGHGRSPEIRELVASTDLNGYLAWPGVAPVFRLERSWRERGQTKRTRH